MKAERNFAMNCVKRPKVRLRSVKANQQIRLLRSPNNRDNIVSALLREAEAVIVFCGHDRHGYQEIASEFLPRISAECIRNLAHQIAQHLPGTRGLIQKSKYVFQHQPISSKTNCAMRFTRYSNDARIFQ